VSSIGDAMREGKLTDLLHGKNRNHSGTDAGLPAASGRRGYRGGDDPGQFGSERRRLYAAPPGIPGGLHLRGGLQERDSVIALVNLSDAERCAVSSGPTGIRLKFDDVLNGARPRTHRGRHA